MSRGVLAIWLDVEMSISSAYRLTDNKFMDRQRLIWNRLAREFDMMRMVREQEHLRLS